MTVTGETTSDTARRPIPAAVADSLRLTKQQYLDSCKPGTLSQTGGCAIGEQGEVQLPADIGSAADATIETFTVAGGVATPLGDQRAAEPWLAAVTTLAAMVASACADADIELAEPIYVTASFTPFEEVNGDAHFDDEQVDASAGMGLVAILASDGGPCLATEAIPCDRAEAPLPLQVPDQAFASFNDGSLGKQRWPADQVVLFPQFAQLHSGPGPIAGGAMRRLLVLRAATIPVS